MYSFMVYSKWGAGRCTVTVRDKVDVTDDKYGKGLLREMKRPASKWRSHLLFYQVEEQPVQFLQ